MKTQTHEVRDQLAVKLGQLKQRGWGGGEEKLKPFFWLPSVHVSMPCLQDSHPCLAEYFTLCIFNRYTSRSGRGGLQVAGVASQSTMGRGVGTEGVRIAGAYKHCTEN